MSPQPTEPPIRCAECGQLWDDPAERWQAQIPDLDELAYYCPECAKREFSDHE